MEEYQLDELRVVLELATEEELQNLTTILFSRKFNPIDYIKTPEPIEVQSQSHQKWPDAIDQRFRFLAADGMTVLRGQTNHVSYRQALIQVCKYLRISYSHNLETVDLEAEIFLFLIGKVWKKLPYKKQQELTTKLQTQLENLDLRESLPLSWQQDPLGIIFKGGSALAVTSLLQPLVLQKIAHQFAVNLATYEIARFTAIQGGKIAKRQFQGYMSVQMAKRGMTINAARYGAARSIFALVGPIMWTWFFADLGWRAIATNYSRIIPTIFTLAQIRLTHVESWEFA